MGLKREPVRYTLAEQNLLPKFDPLKEPGWSRAPSAATPTAAAKRGSFFNNPFTSKNTVKSSRPMIQAELGLGAVPVVRNDLNEADVELVPARLAPRRELEEKRQPAESLEARPTSSGRNRGWNELTARLFEAGGLRS
jgi:hypothetical protein